MHVQINFSPVETVFHTLRIKTLAQKDKLERYDPRSKTFFSSHFAVQPPDREGVLCAADAGPQVPRRRVFQRLRPAGRGHKGGGPEGHGGAALQGHRHTAQVWLKERRRQQQRQGPDFFVYFQLSSVRGRQKNLLYYMIRISLPNFNVFARKIFESPICPSSLLGTSTGCIDIPLTQTHYQHFPSVLFDVFPAGATTTPSPTSARASPPWWGPSCPGWSTHTATGPSRGRRRRRGRWSGRSTKGWSRPTR